MTDYDYQNIRICPNGCGWVLTCVHLEEVDRQKLISDIKEQSRQLFEDGYKDDSFVAWLLKGE